MEAADSVTPGRVAARRTAVVSAAFCALVLTLLIANSIASRRIDPLEPNRVTSLQLALNRNPSDERLRSELRVLDRRMRATYFRGRAFALTGFYLLLGGVAVFLLSLEAARAGREVLPSPRPEAPREAWLAAITARRGIGALGVVLGGLLLTLTVLSRHDAAAEYARHGASWVLVPPQIQHADQPAVGSVPSSLAAPGGPPAGALAAPTAAAAAPQPGGLLAPPSPTTDLAPMPVAPPPAVAMPPKPHPGPAPTRHVGPASPRATVSAGAALEWPGFRGPGGVGIAAPGSYPTKWDGARRTNVVWKAAVPLPGRNSPVVWGRRVFLTGAEKDKREVYCFDAARGTLLWRRTVPIPAGQEPVKVSPDAGYAPATAATDGKCVCAVFVNGDVACFDLAGKPLWTRSLGKPDNQYGHASSLLFYGSGLIVQMDQGSDPQDGKSALYALDSVTGTPVWQVKRPVGASWATPIVIRAGGRDELITCSNPLVIAHDPRSGAELWRAEWLGGEVTPSPVFGGGLVYACNQGAALAAIRPGGSGDVTKSGTAWSFQEDLPDIVSPLYANGMLFLITSQGMVTCLDAQACKRLWQHDFAAKMNPSPVLADGRVYLQDGKGVMHVFEAARAYKEVATAQLGEEASATPAFARGRIYLRGAKSLFCVGDRK